MLRFHILGGLDLHAPHHEPHMQPLRELTNNAHIIQSPMSRAMQRLLGSSHANGEAQLPATAKPPRLPITPPEGEEIHGNTLDYHTIAASAIYCKVSAAFLKAPHHASRHSPSPNINHPTSGSCSVSSSCVWLIFNCTPAVLLSPDLPQQC